MYYLFSGDGLLVGFVQVSPNGLIVTQVHLASHQNDGKTRAEMQNLRDPLTSELAWWSRYIWRLVGEGYLLLHVIERIWGVNGEADQDDV